MASSNDLIDGPFFRGECNPALPGFCHSARSCRDIADVTSSDSIRESDDSPRCSGALFTSQGGVANANRRHGKTTGSAVRGSGSVGCDRRPAPFRKRVAVHECPVLSCWASAHLPQYLEHSLLIRKPITQNAALLSVRVLVSAFYLRRRNRRSD